jgi:hypothetical protein
MEWLRRTVRSPYPADGYTEGNDTSAHGIDLEFSLGDIEKTGQSLTHHAILPPPAEVRIPKALLLNQLVTRDARS